MLGKRLLPGDVIALIGGLGAGKTCFIRGVAHGAGVKDSAGVSSPSFTLIQEYAGRVPFYHIDLYRLDSEEEAEELGLDEVMRGGGITAIEWAEKIPSLLPEEILRVHLHATGPQRRALELSATGDRYVALLNELRNKQSEIRT
jgi:tRNA threonylcarbamoyladenosine biosynthesis protein TsaE